MEIFRRLYTGYHVGLLLMRIGLGITFICHGFPKLAGGPESWAGLGEAMQHWGIHFAPTFWGFMGALGECGGGILVMLGLFFRPACVLLVLTMATATLVHLENNDPFSTLSHAMEMGIVFFSLYFIGPGWYSLDYRFSKDLALKV
jgi:putative oxidoreductase